MNNTCPYCHATLAATLICTGCGRAFEYHGGDMGRHLVLKKDGER